MDACRAPLEGYGHQVYACAGPRATDAVRAELPAIVLVDGNDPAALAGVVDIESSLPGIPVLVILNRDHLSDLLDTTQNLVSP